MPIRSKLELAVIVYKYTTLERGGEKRAVRLLVRRYRVRSVYGSWAWFYRVSYLLSAQVFGCIPFIDYHYR